MINVISAYLKKEKYFTKLIDFEENFQSHPNYPSIFAVTDTFSMLQIENVAAKVSKEQLNNLPKTFLALLNDENHNELVLINKSEKTISLTNEKLKTKQITYDDFISKWSKIIIAIEPNKVRENAIEKSTSTKTYALLGFLSFLFVLHIKINNSFNWFGSIGFVLSILGFYISLLIIKEKNNTSISNLNSKFCSFNENTSCDTVIKSSYSKIFKKIEFTDLAIIFFSSVTLTLLFSPSTILFISFLCLLATPILIYSIWLQKFKLKKWCVLCLFVSVLIISIGLLSINSISFDTKETLVFLTSLTIVVFTWFFIKTYMNDNYLLKTQNKEFLKFKRNPEIFKSLLKNVSKIDSFNIMEKILIGEKNASIEITLILSPSCSHCNKAYEDALELKNKFIDKIAINILFNVNPNNKDNQYISIIKNLLQLNKSNCKDIVIALTDWHIKKLSKENWLLKWEQHQIDDNIYQIMNNHYQWCLENNFNYTPVKILNNKLFPNEYNLSEVKYFLTELEEKAEFA